ncbi:MAG: hypothetical protein HRT47_04725 [Candidatus Caenarcaniphilales bacterium]|nr:hypothetical protein [Candidatus Caenarcaniphilales bacterium]
MVEYNNTNKVDIKGAGQSSQANSQVDGLLNGLKSDLKSAVAQGDVTNIELLEATINELESQRDTSTSASQVQQKSITQQYYEDEFGEDDENDNFSIIGPALDDIEIVQLSGEFKTFEEATGFMVNSLNNLDKILASKGS